MASEPKDDKELSRALAALLRDQANKFREKAAYFDDIAEKTLECGDDSIAREALGKAYMEGSHFRQMLLNFKADLVELLNLPSGASWQDIEINEGLDTLLRKLAKQKDNFAGIDEERFVELIGHAGPLLRLLHQVAHPSSTEITDIGLLKLALRTWMREYPKFELLEGWEDAVAQLVDLLGERISPKPESISAAPSALISPAATPQSRHPTPTGFKKKITTPPTGSSSSAPPAAPKPQLSSSSSSSAPPAAPKPQLSSSSQGWRGGQKQQVYQKKK